MTLCCIRKCNVALKLFEWNLWNLYRLLIFMWTAHIIHKYQLKEHVIALPSLRSFYFVEFQIYDLVTKVAAPCIRWLYTPQSFKALYTSRGGDFLEMSSIALLIATVALELLSQHWVNSQMEILWKSFLIDVIGKVWSKVSGSADWMPSHWMSLSSTQNRNGHRTDFIWKQSGLSLQWKQGRKWRKEEESMFTWVHPLFNFTL